MILFDNGYSLSYKANQNQIILNLPQTSETIQNTVSQMTTRRVDVKEEELISLLQLVQLIFNSSEAKMNERRMTMKYDCTKTLEYWHEYKRICHANMDTTVAYECKDNCPLRHEGCEEPTIESITIVQKWSDEHPENPEREEEE